LLVIDVQRAFDDPAWEERNNPDAETRIRGLLAAWRAAGAPVVHVRHESASPDARFRRGTTAFEFKPEADPLPGEPVVEKQVNSAFIGTDLEERLRAAGAEKLVVAGLTTDHCCSSTARMADDLSFETWFVADATATHARGASTPKRCTRLTSKPPIFRPTRRHLTTSSPRVCSRQSDASAHRSSRRPLWLGGHSLK